MSRSLATLALCAALLTVGCAAPEGAGPQHGAPGSEPASGSTSTADAAGPTLPGRVALARRCGDLAPDRTPFRPVRLETRDPDDLLAAAEVEPSSGGGGDGGTVLVLLHQTGSQGLCGFGPFAAQAAARGASSLALDLCGYGASTCGSDLGDDVGEQVRLAVEHARGAMGAERVVLVGASMGGAEAVLAVADGVRVDAWADLSGPNYWDVRSPLDQLGPAPLRAVPGLVAMTTADSTQEIDDARVLADRARARFVGGDGGHGWELLTDADGRLLPVGEQVLGLAGTSTS